MNLKKEVYNLLLKNRRKANAHQYTLPSPDSYPYQWLWDSCFQAIILSYFNIKDAKEEILSLVSKQFDDGLIPHMIYWDKETPNDFPVIEWGKEDTSTITQPPMIAYAVWTIYQKDKDLSFVKKVYPHLYHFYKYLLNERDPHEKHLIGILNPDESGEDNSPRFDMPLNLPPRHDFKDNWQKRLNLVAQNISCNFDAPFCMRNFFWVKDVPFNAIMVVNLRLLSKLAKIVGSLEDARFFAKEADNIVAAMRKLMLDKDIFWSTYGENYQKIELKTWAIFAPLFANIVTQAQAKKLVENHLLNPKHFWTKYPIPTVSLDEPSLDPNDFWRGPTWISVNWFVYKGLKNYGYDDIAKKIKDSSIRLIEKSGFREYFNSQTGAGLGAKDFTWGGLVIDMN